MRLDELEWIEYGHYFDKYETMRVFSLRAKSEGCSDDGEPMPVGNYYIQDKVGNRFWHNVDALTAQAVLYHLLATYPPK